MSSRQLGQNTSTVRFYGPEPALFDRSWVLPDLELKLDMRDFLSAIRDSEDRAKLSGILKPLGIELDS